MTPVLPLCSMRAALAAATVLLVASCSGSGGGGGAPPSDAIVVLAQSDRLTGVVGTTFNLSAVVLATPEPVDSWLWELGGGLTAAGETTSASFATPGPRTVKLTGSTASGQSESSILLLVFAPEGDPQLGADGKLYPPLLGDLDRDEILTALDVEILAAHLEAVQILTERDSLLAADITLDGAIDYDDLACLDEAARAGLQAPRKVLPPSGAPGRIVDLIAPALLDADAHVQVSVQGTLVEPFRPLPGYATLGIPLELEALVAGGAMPIQLEVLCDGAVCDVLPFTLEPPAPPVPGQTLKSLLATLPSSRAALGAATLDYFALLGASPEETAAVTALLDFSNQMMEAAEEDMLQFLDSLPPSALAELDSYARANGLAAAFDTLEGLGGQAGAAPPPDYGDGAASFAALASKVCAVQAALKVAAETVAVAEGACATAQILGFASLLFPALSPAALAELAAACSAFAIPMAIFEVIADLAPDPAILIDVSTGVSDLKPGEQAQIDSTYTFVGLKKTCEIVASTGGGLLSDYIAEKVTQKLLKGMPLGIAASELLELLDDETYETLMESLTALIESTVGAALGAAGIADLIQEIALLPCENPALLSSAEPLDLSDPAVKVTFNGASTLPFGTFTPRGPGASVFSFDTFFGCEKDLTITVGVESCLAALGVQPGTSDDIQIHCRKNEDPCVEGLWQMDSLITSASEFCEDDIGLSVSSVITLMQVESGVTASGPTGVFSGTLVGGTLVISGSHPEEGGTETFTTTVSVSPASGTAVLMTGSTDWSWQGAKPKEQCQGQDQVTATRIE